MRLLLSFVGYISFIIPAAAVSFIGGFPLGHAMMHDTHKGRSSHMRRK